MKKEFNLDYINKFVSEEIGFEVKTELAYIIGKDKLDNGFMEFIDEETYCEGIYAFSIFIRYLYQEYSKCNYWDVYEFIHEEYENCFEKFKKVCFKEEMI